MSQHTASQSKTDSVNPAKPAAQIFRTIAGLALTVVVFACLSAAASSFDSIVPMSQSAITPASPLHDGLLVMDDVDEPFDALVDDANTDEDTEDADAGQTQAKNRGGRKRAMEQQTDSGRGGRMKRQEGRNARGRNQCRGNEHGCRSGRTFSGRMTGGFGHGHHNGMDNCGSSDMREGRGMMRRGSGRSGMGGIGMQAGPMARQVQKLTAQVEELTRRVEAMQSRTCNGCSQQRGDFRSHRVNQHRTGMAGARENRMRGNCAGENRTCSNNRNWKRTGTNGNSRAHRAGPGKHGSGMGAGDGEKTCRTAHEIQSGSHGRRMGDGDGQGRQHMGIAGGRGMGPGKHGSGLGDGAASCRTSHEARPGNHGRMQGDGDGQGRFQIRFTGDRDEDPAMNGRGNGDGRQRMQDRRPVSRGQHGRGLGRGDHRGIDRQTLNKQEGTAPSGDESNSSGGKSTPDVEPKSGTNRDGSSPAGSETRGRRAAAALDPPLPY